MKIPKSVKYVLKKLEENGFKAYIVGGCVRDLLLKRKPKDWDVTTLAKPEQFRKFFLILFIKINLAQLQKK